MEKLKRDKQQAKEKAAKDKEDHARQQKKAKEKAKEDKRLEVEKPKRDKQQAKMKATEEKEEKAMPKKSGVPTAQEQTRKERAAKAEALLHSTNPSADDVIGDAVCALFENWVGLGLDFSQEDMPHFRQLIALSLLNKEFLK